MPELFFKNIVKVDIEKPLERLDCGLVMASGDEMANRFGAELTKNGEAFDLSNCNVKGFLIRPNEETLILHGSVEENIAFVDIPKTGYVYDGSFTLTIKVYGAGFEKAVVIFDGKIAKTTTEIVVDGDYIVYTSEDILTMIDAMEKATSSANEAATAAGKAAYSIDNLSVSALFSLDGEADARIFTDNGIKHIIFTIPKGDKGESFKVLGTYASLDELSTAVRVPCQGDIYNIGTEGSYTMYMCNEYEDDDGNVLYSWLSLGAPSGIRGDTPVKGVDYWTDADKAEMVNDVLSALPNASGVSF